MDAVIGPTGTFKWPLSAVLAPANLRSDSIGVVAWVNQALGKYYVPVSVVPENVAASAPRPPHMIFRPSMDVELFRWRIWRENGGSQIGDWIRVGGDNPQLIRAEQTVSIELRGQPSGPSVVEVAVKYANIDRPQTKTIRVILP